jgi:hypothetical protein
MIGLVCMISAFSGGRNIVADDSLDDGMTVLVVLSVIIAIAALAPILGADTRTPELRSRH